MKDVKSRSPSPDLDSGDEERDDRVIGSAFRWSLAVILPLAAIVAGAIYFINRKPAEKIVETGPTQESKTRVQETQLPKIPFTDITEAAGIDFELENGAYGDKLLPESMCGGCAFFDFDRDDDQDLFLVNANRWPWDTRPAETTPTMRLLRNDGSGKFTDVTVECGLNVTFYGMGAAVGDYDNDGWVDLFVAAVGPDHLFRNVNGKFAETTAAAGVAGEPDGWSTSCGWIDYDRDGDLDLFVCNYVRWSKEIDAKIGCTLDGKLRAYCRPDLLDGTFPYLYRNDGGQFVDVAGQAGLRIENRDTGVPVAKSLGVAPVDLNRDGYIDLVVANDTTRNFLFVNNKNGTFEEKGEFAQIAWEPNGSARGAMGIDSSYFRNDRTLGVVITNFANENSALYCSKGTGLLFSDDAISSGLGPPSRTRLKFGVFFFDSDLDGWLDIFTANGHLDYEITKIQASQTYEQPPQLFRNCGRKASSEFALMPDELLGTDFAKPIVGRGAAYADIDGDGDLDVFIMGVRGRPRLLRNDQALGHHWLRVKLVGDGRESNRDAIGAWVDVHLGKTTLSRQVMPTRSYLSQVEAPLTFGLGDAQAIDKIEIRWPDGKTEEKSGVSIDRMVTFEEGK